MVAEFSEYLASINSKPSIIATDASKSSNLTSIAGTSTHKKFVHRINNINSIFSAEALAISIALDELLTHDRPAYVFTDSKSVLSALVNVNLKSPRIILSLHNKLVNAAHFNPLYLVWVPAHKGIPINEEADRLAKSATEQAIMINFISPEDLISFFRKKLALDAHREYTESSYFSALGEIPPLAATLACMRNRKEDVLIIRFICRMLLTPALLNRFGLVDDANCSICAAIDSIDHILFHCKKFDRERLNLFRSVGFQTPRADSFKVLLQSTIHNTSNIKTLVKFLMKVHQS